jgi:hypothetical protein
VNDRWRERLQIGLFVLGAGLLAWSIYSIGPRNVLEVAKDGAKFLPLIALGSGIYYLFESHAQRSMLGAEKGKIPLAVFFRATLSSLVATLLLPFGRLGAEVLRVTAYAPYVGTARATAASATFQAAALLGTALFGVVCYLFVGSQLGFESMLAWVLLVHAAGSAALGGLLLLLARGASLGRRLARVFPKFAARAGAFDDAAALPISVFAQATAWCLAARAAEVAYFAVILIAVGLPPSISASVVASGIHLVGATVGEGIPNQLGAIEGAFVYFAGALGLGAEPARAIALPLLARAAQYVLAAGALVSLCFVSPNGTRLVEPRVSS